MNKLKNVKAVDYRHVYADFEVLVDTDPKAARPGAKKPRPVMGLKVNPVNDKPFIMPMDYECAKDVAESMLRTLLKVAPQLFTQYAR